VNTNHTGEFTTLRVTYIPYLVMWCWHQWNHAIRRQRNGFH